MTSDKRYLTIRLPEAKRDQLEASAAANYRSLSAEVRLAIDKHLGLVPSVARRQTSPR